MSFILSKKDKELLDGKYGKASMTAIKVLIQIAKAHGASGLIDINQAHIDGCSFAATGEAGLDFAQKLASMGGKVQVPTTLNITSRDIEHWVDFKVPEEFAQKSRLMEKAYLDMGCIPIWTCAPYQQGIIPRFGEHIAWAESNAICFVNSVIGARTARYGDFVDICAALTGRAPNIGYHIKKNRKGEVLINFKNLLHKTNYSTAFYAALGYLIGNITGDLIPVLQGIPFNIKFDQLKALSAAAASSGSVGLFHVLGITPEAPSLEAVFQNEKPKKKIDLSYQDVINTAKSFTTTKKTKVDIIAVGCPHFSYGEILQCLKLLKGRKIANRIEFWIHTNQSVKILLKKTGILKEINKSGARITTDTCILNWPLDNWNFEVLMTNSGKFAHYAPSHKNLEVIFANLNQCIETAITGVWSGQYEI